MLNFLHFCFLSPSTMLAFLDIFSVAGHFEYNTIGAVARMFYSVRRFSCSRVIADSYIVISVVQYILL